MSPSDETATALNGNEDSDLLIAIEQLDRIRERFETEHSDGGTSGRSDSNDLTA